MTGAGGGGVGAGTRCTGFGQGSSRAAVETRFTLLTVRSLGVAFTVQTHSWRTEQRSHDWRGISWICTLQSTAKREISRSVTAKSILQYGVFEFLDWCG